MSGMLPRPGETCANICAFLAGAAAKIAAAVPGREPFCRNIAEPVAPVEQYRGSVHLCRYSAALRSEKHLLVFQYTVLSLKIP